MKCSFKHCKNENDDNLEIISRKKWHIQCKQDDDNMRKTAELYKKAYNTSESYNIMMRSMYNWYSFHTSEYMLFALCKAIRDKKRLNNFFSLYYVFNDLTNKKRYYAYKNPNEQVMYDIVTLSKKEQSKLYSKYGEKLINKYILKIETYCKQTGKTYHNYYITIEEWIKRDREKQLNRHG